MTSSMYAKFWLLLSPTHLITDRCFSIRLALPTGACHMERRFLKGLPSSQTKQIGRSGDSVEIDSSIRNRITIKEPKHEGQLGKSRLEFSDPRCISRTPRPRMSCPEVV